MRGGGADVEEECMENPLIDWIWRFVMVQRTNLERFRSVTGGEDTKSPGPSYYPVPIPVHTYGF